MQPGVEPGKHYKITFKQAETYEYADNRQFNIFVDGRLAYENINILDNVERFTAFDLVRYTMATEDTLRIRFVGVNGDAVSSAILVEEVFIVAMNCGGSSYTDADGVVYAEDVNYLV